MSERVGDGLPGGSRAIGIIGGTGALGRGLALRLAVAGHNVLVGSRDRVRADSAATHLGHGVRGTTNEEAASSELVVIAVPFENHAAVLRGLRSAIGDRVVVDCVNPLAPDGTAVGAVTVAEGSVCEQAQLLLPEARVVGAFHHVSARLLADPAADLDCDVMVVGDDRPATDEVIALTDSVPGLRGVYAGRLRDARQVEALTANLIAVNRRYRVHAGIRVTGFEPPRD